MNCDCSFRKMHGTFKMKAIIAAGNETNFGMNFHSTVNIQNPIYKTKCTISEVILDRSCFPSKSMAWCFFKWKTRSIQYASASDYLKIRNKNCFGLLTKLHKGASNNSCEFTNPNNVPIWVGGWGSGNQVQKKICTPRNTVFICDLFKSYFYSFK